MSLHCSKLKSVHPTSTTSKKKNEAIEKAYDGSDILSRHHNRADDRRSIKEFTNKRREMLMLNMSISTQQEEIDKLHKDLERKEQVLQEKEASLNESMKKFDCFLKELDQKAQQAAKLLDEQLHTKADKEKSLKKMTQQNHIAKSGMRQKSDKIEQCDALVHRTYHHHFGFWHYTPRRLRCCGHCCCH